MQVFQRIRRSLTRSSTKVQEFACVAKAHQQQCTPNSPRVSTVSNSSKTTRASDNSDNSRDSSPQSSRQASPLRCPSSPQSSRHSSPLRSSSPRSPRRTKRMSHSSHGSSSPSRRTSTCSSISSSSTKRTSFRSVSSTGSLVSNVSKASSWWEDDHEPVPDISEDRDEWFSYWDDSENGGTDSGQITQKQLARALSKSFPQFDKTCVEEVLGELWPEFDSLKSGVLGSGELMQPSLGLVDTAHMVLLWNR